MPALALKRRWSGDKLVRSVKREKETKISGHGDILQVVSRHFGYFLWMTMMPVTRYAHLGKTRPSGRERSFKF